MDVVAQIEHAFVAHWSVFGRWTHGELRDQDGVLWFETPIVHLPYNAIIRTHVGGDSDPVIDRVVERFRSRGVQFFWLVHPSAQPEDLRERLAARGLAPVERMTGMSLDLDGWDEPNIPSAADFREVLDDADLEAYQKLTALYWELPDDDAAMVAQLQREWGPGLAPGHRYIALVEGAPVGKGYLSVAGPDGVAAIYGMSTRPEARGRGVASGLTGVLLQRAKELGCTRAVLHSSEMALNVYRRAGFVERCRLEVYATAPIWSHSG